MKAEHSTWIEKAGSDLRKARDVYGIGHLDLAAFLCQQSVEKALKAVLIKKKNKFPKIHTIGVLGRLAGLKEGLIFESVRLDPVYTASRYPGTDETDFDKGDVDEFIKIAERVLKWSKKEIS